MTKIGTTFTKSGKKAVLCVDEEDDSDLAEELLSASDDEDAIMLEELSSSPRELEEFEAISELLLDSISDELDSASELLDSTGVELEDSTLELLDSELLDNPYFE